MKEEEKKEELISTTGEDNRTENDTNQEDNKTSCAGSATLEI